MKKLVLAAVGLFFFVTPRFCGAESLTFRINKRVFNQSEVVMIQKVSKSTTTFSVRFKGRTYESFLFGKYQTVLVGLDYQMKPGRYLISGVYKAGPYYYIPFIFRVKVLEKFPRQKYIPPKRSAETQERINKESGEKDKVFRQKSQPLKRLGPFVRPVRPVHINSRFGEKRCQARVKGKLVNCRYHLGVDYRAAFDEGHQKAEKISAINSGKVVAVADYLADGKTVIVDHGNGITSAYLHLSEAFVRPGAWVYAGQKIGLAGKTGSTNAVHLHLTVKMGYGAATVDPEAIFKLLNRMN